MPRVTPITPARHGPLRWRRYDSYSFASEHAVMPLVAAELGRAAGAFPVAMIKIKQGFTPAAVLGIDEKRNLFVDENGRWLGSYIPAVLRGYPFTLGRRTDQGQPMLCINEASGLVTPGPEGERFFEDDGRPSEAVRQIVEFLTRVEQNRPVTTSACRALEACNLIEPWPLARQTDKGQRKIDGLFRVNQAALDALDDKAFLGLRGTGALTMAYAQLLSMQQIRVLSALAAARAQPAQQMPAGKDLDLSWLQGDTIKFDF